jgi:hypothetical protein
MLNVLFTCGQALSILALLCGAYLVIRHGNTNPPIVGSAGAGDSKRVASFARSLFPGATGERLVAAGGFLNKVAAADRASGIEPPLPI